MNSEQIPVILISGFLGAGKTSVMNALIRENIDVPFYVIENEVGELSVDGALVDTSTRALVELSGGCICCTLDLGFRQALLDLKEKIQPGGVLLIETTGIADPGQIKKVLLSDPVLQSNFRIITTIICLNILQAEVLLQAESEVRSLSARQIAAADILFLTRADLAREAQSAFAQRAGSVWNSLAEIKLFSGEKSELNLDKMIHSRQEKFIHYAPAASLPEVHILMRSESFRIQDPFNLMKFIHRMNVLFKIQGQYMYRAKGWLHIQGDTRKFLFQSAGDSVYVYPVEAWAEDEVRESILVFIGTGINREVLERNLRACVGG